MHDRNKSNVQHTCDISFYRTSTQSHVKKGHRRDIFLRKWIDREQSKSLNGLVPRGNALSCSLASCNLPLHCFEKAIASRTHAGQVVQWYGSSGVLRAIRDLWYMRSFKYNNMERSCCNSKMCNIDFTLWVFSWRLLARHEPSAMKIKNCRVSLFLRDPTNTCYPVRIHALRLHCALSLSRHLELYNTYKFETQWQ